MPTPKGGDVIPVLVALMQWGDRHLAEDGPPRVLVHAECGHDADPALHCSHCDEQLGPGALRVRPGPGAKGRQRDEPLLPDDGVMSRVVASVEPTARRPAPT